LRGLQRAHQLIDTVELRDQQRRPDEPIGRRFAHDPQNLVELVRNVRVLAQARRYRRVERAAARVSAQLDLQVRRRTVAGVYGDLQIGAAASRIAS